MATRYINGEEKSIITIAKKKKRFNNVINTLNNNFSLEKDFSILLSPEYLPLVPDVNKMARLTSDTQVLQPVYNNFHALNQFIYRKKGQRYLDPNFLRTLNEPPSFDVKFIEEAYVKKINLIFNIFIRFLDENKFLKIYNFQDFYNHLKLILKGDPVIPLTFYATATKTLNYFENTGMVINLNDNDITDNAIYEEFIKGTRKKISRKYIKIANQFGFEVDKNNPYKLIYNPFRSYSYKRFLESDGASPEEIRDASKYFTIKQFYKRYFIDYYEIEYYYLTTFLKSFYDSYKEMKPITYSPKTKCLNNIKTTARAIQQEANIPNEVLIEVYLTALMRERNVVYKEERKIIFDTAVQLSKTVDIPAAMRYIMGQVNRLANTKVVPGYDSIMDLSAYRG